MNLIKEYLVSIQGVHIFAIISMLIFLVTFVLMVLHTYSLKKDEVRKFSRLPLEEDEDGQN